MTKRNINTARSFAAAAGYRAEAWFGAEAAGSLTPEADASANVMAGCGVDMRRKGPGSSRAQMEKIAQAAFHHAEVVLDSRSAEIEFQ